MDKNKQEQLEANGWKVGTVSEFLELTPEEEVEVEKQLTEQTYDLEEVYDVLRTVFTQSFIDKMGFPLNGVCLSKNFNFLWEGPGKWSYWLYADRDKYETKSFSTFAEIFQHWLDHI